MATSAFAGDPVKGVNIDLRNDCEEIDNISDSAGNCTGTFWVIDQKTGKTVGAFTHTVQTSSEQACFDYVSGGTLALADKYLGYDFKSSGSYN